MFPIGLALIKTIILHVFDVMLGIQYNTGSWSQEESYQLKKNWQKIVKV